MITATADIMRICTLCSAVEELDRLKKVEEIREEPEPKDEVAQKIFRVVQL